MKSDLGGNLMPKLFDEFDLDLRKINEMKPMSEDGGDSNFACGSGTNTCGCTDSCGCPTYELTCWIKE